MGRENLILAIVLSDNIKQVSQAVVIVVTYIGPEESLSHRPGWIGFVTRRHERTERLLGAFSICSITNFIAYTVNHDAGMVAVSLHGVARIAERPVAKIEMVIVRILADGPGVEHLIHHQKSHSVRQIKKFGRRRIVRSTNRIYT